MFNMNQMAFQGVLKVQSASLNNWAGLALIQPNLVLNDSPQTSSEHGSNVINIKKKFLKMSRECNQSFMDFKMMKRTNSGTLKSGTSHVQLVPNSDIVIEF